MDPLFIDALHKKAYTLGIEHLSSSPIDLGDTGEHLNHWLDNGYHAEMEYMARHGEKRYRPELLVEETRSILTCQLNYYNPDAEPLIRLTEKSQAYVANYALGRDYHRVLRNALNQLGRWLQEEIPDLQFRAFVDSAPVMERAISQQAGLGFMGKNTMLIHPKRGSLFFLGEIYLNQVIDIAQPPIKNHCGACTRCITACPTDAIVEPFMVDAKRCISYLTIEHFGAIPEEFRQPMGNRIFGCDDCQLVCPWNRFAVKHTIDDFKPRNHLDNSSLLSLFSWSEDQFLKRTEGSPIRRLGHERWQRNIAIAIGNDDYHPDNIDALNNALPHSSTLVKEHIEWALNEQMSKNPL